MTFLDVKVSPERPFGKRPRFGVVALLTVIHPGVGHVYLGRGLRGVGVVAIVYGALLVLGLSGAMGPLTSIGVVVLLVTGMSIGLFADAMLLAKEPPRETGRKVWVRCAIAGIALNAASVSLFHWNDRIFGYGISSISSPAMAPTLEKGEMILWDARAYRGERQPIPGEVVVLRAPADGNEPWVERVVGVSGDSISVKGNFLEVNGIAVDEPYLGDELGEVADYGPEAVPSGSVFVLGDNRSLSSDSRSRGPIRIADIQGKVDRILWSLDPEKVGLTLD